MCCTLIVMMCVSLLPYLIVMDSVLAYDIVLLGFMLPISIYLTWTEEVSYKDEFLSRRKCGKR